MVWTIAASATAHLWAAIGRDWVGHTLLLRGIGGSEERTTQGLPDGDPVGDRPCTVRDVDAIGSIAHTTKRNGDRHTGVYSHAVLPFCRADAHSPRNGNAGGVRDVDAVLHTGAWPEHGDGDVCIRHGDAHAGVSPADGYRYCRATDADLHSFAAATTAD